jgi:hypothetical protein
MKPKTLVISAFITFAAAPVWAEEFRCTGSVGAVALDNIFVPDGASCTLTRTRANGNIVVGTGASLVANGVSINGNLQAEGAHSITVLGHATFGGSVQLVKGNRASIERTRIKGDILFDENTGPLAALGNTVGGNVQAFKNYGGVTLRNNRIGGNLQCKENIPAPSGGGNQASSKEDQCERL